MKIKTRFRNDKFTKQVLGRRLLRLQSKIDADDAMARLAHALLRVENISAETNHNHSSVINYHEFFPLLPGLYILVLHLADPINSYVFFLFCQVHPPKRHPTFILFVFLFRIASSSFETLVSILHHLYICNLFPVEKLPLLPPLFN